MFYKVVLNILSEIMLTFPLLLTTDRTKYTQAFICAYLTANLPVIVLLKLTGHNESFHAVVITGFKKTDYQDEIKLLLHDDQFGPYTEATLKSFDRITCSWVQDKILDGVKNRKSRYRKAEIDGLVCPISPDIRITFGSIYYFYKRIKTRLEKTIRETFDSEIEFEVFLMESNEYKHYLLTADVVAKEKYLVKSLPKYIWITRFYIDKKPIRDNLTDSTGSSIDTSLICIIQYQELIKLIKQCRQRNKMKPINS